MREEIRYEQIIPQLSDISNDISGDDEIVVFDKSSQTSKKSSLTNLSTIIASDGQLIIGGNINGAIDGSVLFVGTSGILSQDNDRFFYDSNNNSLKLIDKDYEPFSGALTADTMFSVGSNDNQQNNAGVINTSNHFVGSAVDLKITASGANKTYRGQFTQFRVGGSYTGSGVIYGHHVILNNRLSSASTPSLYGIEASINIEGDFTEAVGISGIAYRGTTITGDNIVGVRGQAANGYSNALTVTGGEFITKTVSTPGNIDKGRSVWAKIEVTSGHTINKAYGLALDGWTNSGDINKSYGIYASASIDIGSESYFIYSLSTSPSIFSGDVWVPDDAYGVDWNNNFEVPTKNAIYNQIEAITIGTYTDEDAQDAVGDILEDGNTVSIQYNDFDNVITAEVIDNSLTFNYLQNISSNRLLGRHTASAGDIETIKIGDGLALDSDTLVLTSLNNGSVTKINNINHIMTTDNHYIFYIADFTANRDFNLLSAGTIEGKEIYIKAPGNLGGFDLNIVPAGSETIDSSGTVTLTADNSYIRLMAVDGNWKIIDKGVPSF